jgi:hypothetical protein
MLLDDRPLLGPAVLLEHSGIDGEERGKRRHGFPRDVPVGVWPRRLPVHRSPCGVVGTTVCSTQVR